MPLVSRGRRCRQSLPAAAAVGQTQRRREAVNGGCSVSSLRAHSFPRAQRASQSCRTRIRKRCTNITAHVSIIVSVTCTCAVSSVCIVLFSSSCRSRSIAASFLCRSTAPPTSASDAAIPCGSVPDGFDIMRPMRGCSIALPFSSPSIGPYVSMSPRSELGPAACWRSRSRSFACAGPPRGTPISSSMPLSRFTSKSPGGTEGTGTGKGARAGTSSGSSAKRHIRPTRMAGPSPGSYAGQQHSMLPQRAYRNLDDRLDLSWRLERKNVCVAVALRRCARWYPREAVAVQGC